MKLAGDPVGIDELKHIKDNNLFFLKFLLKEAETSLERFAEFKSKDGKQKYKLVYSPVTKEFTVEKIS